MARIHKVTPTAVVRAEWWDADESVTLRTYLSGYDRAVLHAGLARLRQDGADDATVSYAGTLLMLLTCVESWTFRYDPEPGQEVGAPIPITAETLKALDQEDFAFIASEMHRHLAAWRRDSDPPPATEEDAKKARFRRKQAALPGV